MAAAAVPVASSLIAPEVAAALGSTALGTSLASSAPWLMPAIAGAGMGGIGSLLTGQDPLKGALFGGIGGGLGSALDFGGLFGGGINPSAEATAGALSSATPNAAAQGLGSTALDGSGIDKFANSFSDIVPSTPALNLGASAAGAVPEVASSGGGGLSKFLPYGAVGLGALALDRMTAPDSVGPGMEERNKDYAKVKPMERQYQDVDPQSYFTTGGNRSYFDSVSPRPMYYSKGGRAKYANGGSSSASSSNIPPIKKSSKYVKGRGDGQSDEIPAMLSDGEFVFSAPAVSALGRGSNDAGARKLNKMQKDIMHKHYKGGKAPKAMGLGGYVH